MSLRCYIIPADCTNDIHYKQSCPKQKQTVHNHILWLNIKCSIQIAQNLRKCKINRTDHKCTEHIKKEHSLIWLIIAYKFLHNFHSKIPPFRILHYYTRIRSGLQFISTDSKSYKNSCKQKRRYLPPACGLWKHTHAIMQFRFLIPIQW